MSGARANHRNDRRRSAASGALADDLFIQDETWPRIGRPPNRDLETWRVIDDWPARVPVSDAEIDIFEAWFGDLFDELFGPCR